MAGACGWNDRSPARSTDSCVQQRGRRPLDQQGACVDWVVSKEFEFVLRGHPKIDRILVFDKKTGLRGWFRLIRERSKADYDYRVDLHRTLRTSLAFLYFRVFTGGRILRVSKERIRSLLLLALKRGLPRFLRPTPYWRRFALLAGRIRSLEGEPRPPDFLHLTRRETGEEEALLDRYGLQSRQFYSLMPSSRWPSKEWGVDRFFETIRLLEDKGRIPLLLGRESDEAARLLRERLVKERISFRDALSEPEFGNSAVLLKHSAFYLGCDTGLSHLAEAVGCPAFVIFGPTRPELGFGPARPASRALAAPVACSPCSKDGRVCYRFTDPHACMSRIEPVRVAEEISRCGF
ncbi:MAG: glycosyltransferase family 9 protein [Proteobacteria bacterium]|nr:glycosyltransferase family 9 protein [Pseudomonadota bacterium]